MRKEKTAIVVVILATFLCIASLSPFASAQCDHNVTVDGVCCGSNQTFGWFYNETGWSYSSTDHPDYTSLFILSVVPPAGGDEYNAYCINYEVPLMPGDTFNASIYVAEPTCKNNSIAYILNNWIIDCGNCDNVSAGQSAVWYFWYIYEPFCSGGEAKYNHTATPSDPNWESNWIPDCTAHPLACDFINDSINKSVPYNITLIPSTGDYIKGTPVVLEATVSYCDGRDRAEVTVVFKTDSGTFSESGTNVYENETVNGKCTATLVCDTVGSANVTARVKDMKWFEIVDPIGCQLEEYQPTLRIINLTDDAAFSFSEEPKIPGISIVKLVNGLNTYTAVHNETVTFTLNVTNTGTANLTNLTVIDALPLKQANKGLTYADAANPHEDGLASSINPAGWIHFTIHWYGYTDIIGNLTQFEPLKPGDSFEITFNATVDPEACGMLRDIATVTAKSDSGNVSVSDSDDAFVYVKCVKVPLLTPFGIAALIGLLSLVAVLSMSKGARKKRV